MIRDRAAAAYKTISRYVLALALDDDPDRHTRGRLEERYDRRAPTSRYGAGNTNGYASSSAPAETGALELQH